MNTMKQRTKWGICLGPTGNMQGSYKFMSLSTGKKIVRRKFTEMPMALGVMKQINKWAKNGPYSEWTDVLEQERHGV
jgi:hypothetical protein